MFTVHTGILVDHRCHLLLRQTDGLKRSGEDCKNLITCDHHTESLKKARKLNFECSGMCKAMQRPALIGQASAFDSKIF